MSVISRLRSCLSDRDSLCGRTLSVWLGAALAFGLLCAGCGDDSTDVPRDFGTAQMRLEAHSTINNAGNRINFSDSDGTVYTLTSARLVIHEIELELPDNLGCDDVEDQLQSPIECDEGDLELENDELKIDGPFVVDLVEGTTTPDLGTFNIPALDYQEIDIEVDDIEQGDDVLDQGDELIDHTFAGLADFEFENQKRELFLQFSFSAEAETDDLDLSLDNGETLIVSFDAASWLDDIPVTQCLQQNNLKTQDGRVTVDGDVGGDCDDAEERFEENFADSVDAFAEEGQDPLQ